MYKRIIVLKQMPGEVNKNLKDETSQIAEFKLFNREVFLLMRVACHYLGVLTHY